LWHDDEDADDSTPAGNDDDDDDDGVKANANTGMKRERERERERENKKDDRRTGRGAGCSWTFAGHSSWVLGMFLDVCGMLIGGVCGMLCDVCLAACPTRFAVVFLGLKTRLSPFLGRAQPASRTSRAGILCAFRELVVVVVVVVVVVDASVCVGRIAEEKNRRKWRSSDYFFSCVQDSLFSLREPKSTTHMNWRRFFFLDARSGILPSLACSLALSSSSSQDLLLVGSCFL
jgi:hypothetical protein